MKFKRIVAAVTVAVIGVVAAPSLVGAVSSTQVVREGNVAILPEDVPPTNNWVAYTRYAGAISFKAGPASPPLGTGSLELTTPTGDDKISVFNFDHAGTPLRDVSALSYSTYRAAGDAQQVASINIQVDSNGIAPGGFTTLVFEPAYNTDQGAVVSGEWQDWNAYNQGQGVWWSSNPISAAPNRDTFVSWETIVNANPQAVIVGGVGVNQGSGNPALVTSVDALVFGNSVDTFAYDFEGPVVLSPTSKDQCKNGGYLNFLVYKNQGDCVSDVVSNSNADKAPVVEFMRTLGF